MPSYIPVLIIFGVVNLACMRLFIRTQTDNISGKLVSRQETEFKRVWLPIFVRDIQKNLICHGDSNARRIKAFSFYLLVLALVATVGYFGVHLPSAWISITDDAGTRSTVSFTVTAYLIGNSILNGISKLLFPSAEKAKLIRNIILKSKELPDQCNCIQIAPDQVIVDYRNNTIEYNEFAKHQRQLSEACGCRISLKPLEFGRFLLTFGETSRINLNWRRDDGTGIIKTEKQRYLYALLTGQEIKSERILKQGICTDVEATLTTYGRGLTSPRFFFVLEASNGLTEAIMKDHFEKYLVELPNRKGEFYRECDGWYECADQFLRRWRKNLTPELEKYLSYEIQERNVV